jgi:plastocyanin
MKKLIALLTATAVALSLAITAMAAVAGGAKLAGTVGPGFTITLTKGGKKVTKLKPGKYTFAIDDKSDFHDFHLTGPGVNKTTTVPFVGRKTWKLTLKKGTYRFVCDPHSAQMHGSFRVG